MSHTPEGQEPLDERAQSEHEPVADIGVLGEINLGSGFGFGQHPSIHPPSTLPSSDQQAGTGRIKELLDLPSILFAPRSSSLTREGLVSLNTVAEILLQTPASIRLEVQGFADISGSATINRSLSQDRALAAASYLVNQGVPDQMLRIQGFGATSEFDTDDDTGNGPAGPESNRCVRFQLIITLRNKDRTTFEKHSKPETRD